MRKEDVIQCIMLHLTRVAEIQIRVHEGTEHKDIYW